MNKNLREDILLSFWLPLRKSNFINEIDEYNQDNLVYKIIKLSTYYQLKIKNFNINLAEHEHDNIFKNGGTSENKKAYIRKHLIRIDDDTIDIFESKVNDTISEYRYHISARKIKKNNNSFDVNFKKKLGNNINYISLDFIFTDKSIQKLEEIGMGKKNYSNIRPTLLTSLTFNFVIDEYGFYFINTDIHSINFYNYFDIQLRVLFLNMFFTLSTDEKFNILTYDQTNIIQDGLLFEYDINNSVNDLKLDNLKKIEDFFKKIIKVYRFQDFSKQENFSIKSQKELDYILDYRNDHILKQKSYNLSFFEYCFNQDKTSNQSIVKKRILNTNPYMQNEKIEYLYKLFLQDEIEKNAINSFLETATSISYVGEIIKHIEMARDNLRVILNLNRAEEYNRIITNTPSKDVLIEYVTKIFSKIPNLKKIDTFLQESYHIKIKSYYIDGSEKNIHSINNYFKWKNLLNDIDNTAQSLEIILSVYHNRETIEELEELRQKELSTSDKNDVQNISQNRDKIILDNDERDFLLILSILIAFSSLYGDSWNWILNFYTSITNNDNLSQIFSFFTAIFTFYMVIKLAPYLSKFIFQSNRKRPVHFFGINTIELRSKTKLNIQIPHESDHDFTKKIDTILSRIERTINNVILLKKGKRRILFTRANSQKRVINIKYIFDKNIQNQNNNFLDLRDLNINNKHTKIKFFVVYSFILKEDENDINKFSVYNNFAKVFYNLGSTKYNHSIDDESEIRQRLYEIFLKEFNIH